MGLKWDDEVKMSKRLEVTVGSGAKSSEGEERAGIFVLTLEAFLRVVLNELSLKLMHFQPFRVPYRCDDLCSSSSSAVRWNLPRTDPTRTFYLNSSQETIKAHFSCLRCADHQHIEWPSRGGSSWISCHRASFGSTRPLQQVLVCCGLSQLDTMLNTNPRGGYYY